MSKNKQAAQNMIDHGGSFVHKLGEAWFLADSTNKKLLEQAFYNYFEQYFNDFCKGSK